MQKAALTLLTTLLLGTTSHSLTADDDIAITSQRRSELLHLLKQDCGSCHGLTLKGGLGPALLPENLTGKPEPLLTATIYYGRPGTAMPPWQSILTESESRWLARRLLEGVSP
ncbi:c-type cytochrome [Kistimonas asteriae]|uniref:c-type cytochrome n=1 Tax=Kistimonas asteriae TaxID=517724 RepID=UPI001BA54F46